MLIEFIPVMLFILGWNPENPDAITMQREPVLFASIADCEAASAKVLERMRAEDAALQYTARCVEIPERSEFDELLNREFDTRQ